VSLNAQDYINARFDGAGLKEPIDYHLLLNAGEGAKGGKGKNVTVGILDHPIPAAIPFKNPVQRPFSKGIASANHGAFIAGLISGLDPIHGIAPECHLLELPLYDADGYVLPEAELRKVLDHVIAIEKPMLLNVSQGLAGKFKPQLEAITAKHIVIACAGSNAELTGNIRFPASLTDVIAVGCLGKDFLSHKLDPKVDVVIPDINFVSFGLLPGKFNFNRGDSFSCAIVSAIAALVMSSLPEIVNVNKMRAQIKMISKNFSDPSSIDLLNPIIPDK